MNEAILLFMAGAVPFEQLVADLKEATAAYENSTSEEDKEAAKAKILIASLLVVSKEKVEQDGSIMKSIKGYEKSKEAHDIGSRIMGTDKES